MYLLTLLNDEELIDELIKKQSYGALKELVVRYSNDAFNFAYHFVFNKNKAKIITKKIFVDIWRCPYKYQNSFKILFYKKIKKLVLKEKISEELDFKYKNILKTFKKDELFTINLYYFSGLNDKDISTILSNVKQKINIIEKDFAEKFNFELLEFMSDITSELEIPFDLHKDLIQNAVKYRRKDKYENFIIFFGMLPVCILILIVLYSIFTQSKHF